LLFNARLLVKNPARCDLVFVTAGLELEGGGRASFARLFGRACAEYSAERGIDFRVLSLRGGFPIAGATPVRTFQGRKVPLTLAVWRAQLRRPRPALVFDLLGLARSQTFLPGSLRAPFMLVLHGVEVWRPLRRAELAAIRQASRRLVNSVTTRDRALPFVRLQPEEIEVLHLALEARRPEGVVDKQMVALAGEGFLLIVGRLAATERYKGHDQLLDGLPELLRRCPDARLVVVGDGDDRPRLEAKVRAVELEKHVLFTGFVNEATLDEVYRRCAAFVMPSKDEGFGLVYLEAMRAGKPCVAATGTAAAEIVVDRFTGYLVDPEDPGSLAEVLARLLNSPGLAGALGKAGWRRWQRHFSFERFSREVSSHLDHLTDLHDVRH
jgi:phosphatidylinositol alpha-1,6-mannosyltransferase